MPRRCSSTTITYLLIASLICTTTIAYYTHYNQSPEDVDIDSDLSFLVPPETNLNKAAVNNEISNTVVSMLLRETCEKMRKEGSASLPEYCNEY